jgi:hypothetical protein
MARTIVSRRQARLKSSLLKRTRMLLAASPQSAAEIARETKLGKSWIESLPRSAHPSVVRVQTLYEYLSGRVLKI